MSLHRQRAALRPRRSQWRAAALAVLLAAGPVSAARGVTFIEQAQRLERIYAALLDLRPGAAPSAEEPPLELALEVVPVPAIDHRVGAKTEPVRPPPLIPRLRLRLHHNAADALGLMAGATYEPPLTLGGYTAQWLGGEGGLAVTVRAITLAARVFALDALVTGPVTAPGARDEFSLATRGGDLRAGVALGGWRAYAGYGAGRLEALLTVGTDGARIRENGGYLYRFGGVAYHGPRWSGTLEQHTTEDYLRHVILGVSWRF